jgi:hypothetical protein
MTLTTNFSHPSNGNGSAVNGRGLRHRKMTRSEALELAADIACGRRFDPSLHHLADIFSLPIGSLSKAVKARAATQEASAAPMEVDYMDFPIEPTEPVELIEKEKALSALVHAWHFASFEVREGFVREVGVDAVWDVIARLIR